MQGNVMLCRKQHQSSTEDPMKFGRGVILALTCACLVPASGCVPYPISKKYRQEAVKDITFPMVLENPDKYRGALVIWGGRIIETANDSNRTRLIVLQIPIDNSERPVNPAYTEGRFIAISSIFLDPIIYYPGRLVTIAGTVTGSSNRQLDSSTYRYPVIRIEQIRLWQRVVRYYYYPGWYYPNYGPWGYNQQFFDGDFYDGYGGYYPYYDEEFFDGVDEGDGQDGNQGGEQNNDQGDQSGGH